MSTIKYSIQFYSQWHCGSGLSAGADVDALVIKDKDGLPYIPGRTIKGLIREAVEDYIFLSNQPGCEALVEECFGMVADKDTFTKGSVFFTNATLSNKEHNALVANQAQQFVYNRVSSTAIGNDGKAQEHSLRKTETVVPCILHGEIHHVDEGMKPLIEKGMCMVKRLGQGRTRGLGRCQFLFEGFEEEGGQA